MRYGALVMAAAMLAATIACEDDGSSLTDPEGRAVIEGRVESTTAMAAGPAGSPAAAAQATTVAAMHVGAGGSTEALAEASVAAGGEFRIEDVPEGRTDLIVVARNEAGAEVGRVLVHGETEAEAVSVVAPIDAETTVEGGAFLELHANGDAESAANPGGLAAFVRMSGPEAEVVASSSAAVEAVAHAYAESESSLGAAFGELGVDLDAEARGELTAPLALEYAMNRDGGASVDAAHAAFVQGILAAYAGVGASNRDIALATAASGSGAAYVSVGSHEDARLAVVRQSFAVNLEAREGLAADVSGFAGGTATVEALAQARADLEGAGSVAEVEAGARTVAATVEAAVVADVLDLLSGFPLLVRDEVHAEIEAAFAEADLAARLEGVGSAEGRATALVDYRADVEAAAEAVAAAMPDEVSLDTEAMVSLLIAACGSAAVS